MSKLIGYFLNIIIVSLMLIIVTCTSLLIKYSVNTRVTPKLFGYTALIILSGSMAPSLSPGDIALVKNTGESSISAGDTISYKINENEIVTHRVVSIVRQDGKLLLTTKGDANNSTDDKNVLENQVIGVVKAKIPYIGHIVQYIKIGQVFTVFVLVQTIALVVIDIKPYLTKKLKSFKQKHQPAIT